MAGFIYRIGCPEPRQETINDYLMTTSQKSCFGILDQVFPMGKEGLREIVPACFECPERKACLQAALQTQEGFELRSQVLDRSSPGGLVGRLRRWSEKKELSRLKKAREGDRKWPWN
ncbi:MAG: hypothetical protein JRL30_06610 [Deltaproteobacteria bacterium]|nr:hypothetical protein [Deltaproteobacteria bacterium]